MIQFGKNKKQFNSLHGVESTRWTGDFQGGTSSATKSFSPRLHTEMGRSLALKKSIRKTMLEYSTGGLTRNPPKGRLENALDSLEDALKAVSGDRCKRTRFSLKSDQ